MSLSKNPAAYTHVQQVLDAALPHTLTKYDLGTKPKAARFRAEAYQYRRLLSDRGDNRYAGLILRLEGTAVIIEGRHAAGPLITHDGTVIQPATPREVLLPEDSLEREAFALARGLGLDIE